jgi:hypothetical protein
MPRGRRWIIFGLVSLIIATFCWRPPATAAEPLFASDEILDLTISGPLRSLARNTSSTTAFPGWLELGNAEKTPVVLSKYGISRLSECDLPLFKIDVEEKHARDTPFEGIHSLRLVTPCHHLRGYDRYILLEYLVYKRTRPSDEAGFVPLPGHRKAGFRGDQIRVLRRGHRRRSQSARQTVARHSVTELC